jgi:dsDNA-specific endonuclease/ATPase MutS2
LETKDDIDYFIEALEEMIDARDDMWEEEKHHNYRGEMKIREERYEPARDKLRFFLSEMIRNLSTK